MTRKTKPKNSDLNLRQRIDMYATDADGLAQIPLKHVAFIGLEDEGAVPEELRDTDLYHYDSSVEVVGDGDGDCSCRDNCECPECRRCTGCDCRLDSCECSGCIVCSECENIWADCDCYYGAEYAVEGCQDCIDNDGDACGHHVREAFDDNSILDCYSGCNDTYTSCDMDCGCEHDCGNGDGIDGEIVSPALPYEKVLEFMDNHHVLQSNNTCGGHRHFSFKSNMRAQSILLNREFNDLWLPTWLEHWGRTANINKDSAFYQRLAGDVHWCKRNYDAIGQLMSGRSKEEYRYRRVNYCYGLHETMEIRVLPEFQKFSLMRASTIALAHIVDEFVEQYKDDIKLMRVSI